jgi:hypothetical protein
MQNAYNPDLSNNYLGTQFSVAFLFYISFSTFNVLCILEVVLHEFSVCSLDRGNIHIKAGVRLWT